MSDPVTQNITATTGAGANVDTNANYVIIVTCPVGGIINLPTVVDGKQLYIRNDAANPCTIKFAISAGTFVYNIPSTFELWFTGNSVVWFTNRSPIFFATANVTIPANIVSADVVVDTSLASYKVSLPPVLAGAKYEFVSATSSSGTNKVTVSSTSGAVLNGIVASAGPLISLLPTIVRVSGVTNIVFSNAGGPSDRIEFKSDGVVWYFSATTGTAGGFTTS